MSTTAVVLLVVAIAAVGAFVVFLYNQRTTKKLREKFGPEYNRAVRQAGTTRDAEAQLQKTEKRVARYHIRPLQPTDRDRFAQTWRSVQARFVDDPQGAVRQGDALLEEVMTARGYPVSTFEQATEDLSVDHPLVVENYRAGHAIARRHADGHATTEDLRQAMIHYRVLFDDLLGLPTRETARETSRAARAS